MLYKRGKCDFRTYNLTDARELDKSDYLIKNVKLTIIKNIFFIQECTSSHMEANVLCNIKPFFFLKTISFERNIRFAQRYCLMLWLDFIF